MKKIFQISAIMFSMLVTACSGRNQGTEENLLLAFRLTYEGMTYNGNINHSDGTILFEGITRGNNVEAAAAFLADGAAISPDPKTYVGNWPASSVFEVRKGDVVKKYEVMLPDLIDKASSSHVVMGYVQPAAWNFGNYFDLIDWNCLTHIIPSFCYVQPDASLKTDVLDNYISRIAAKAKENGVKVIVSVRSTTGQSLFSPAVATPELREKLAQNIMAYVRKYDLDGVDIDFEEYEKVGTLQSQLYDLFERIRSKMDDDMIFSSAIIPGDWVKYGTQWHTWFDYINIMSYDTPRTAQQFASYESYVWDIDYCYNTLKIPYSKLAAGMPFYGHTWEDGIPGTDSAGGITFHNIMEHYRSINPDAVNLDNIGKTYYNGHATIRRKCEYAKEKGIAGVMIWQLFQDARRPDESLLKVVGDAMFAK